MSDSDVAEAVTAEALVRRLQRLEDRHELSDLVARYCVAVDDRDLDTLVELFAPDGGFGHHGMPVEIGPDAIRALYRERLGRMTYSVHYPHTQLLDCLDDERAAGVVIAHAEMGRAGAPPLVGAMRYHDSYRRVAGRWRFARREVRFWYLAAADEVSSGLGPQRKQWPGRPQPAELPETLPSYQRFLEEAGSKEASQDG